MTHARTPKTQQLTAGEAWALYTTAKCLLDEMSNESHQPTQDELAHLDRMKTVLDVTIDCGRALDALTIARRDGDRGQARGRAQRWKSYGPSPVRSASWLRGAARTLDTPPPADMRIGRQQVSLVPSVQGDDGCRGCRRETAAPA